jgi:hypothetical protein
MQKCQRRQRPLRHGRRAQCHDADADQANEKLISDA